ncbi:hypothetical protein H632_c676p0 [Helicosporidium sp. ATCC 50920]|nr:hypothetical protein H632_c676p0 [Helicosporidium sp. ATCC 50920]|eukprot:KDD75455.1 hypothetical protein H632_c676p0 [Helicosporidium sp. ATCC 50920]
MQRGTVALLVASALMSAVCARSLTESASTSGWSAGSGPSSSTSSLLSFGEPNAATTSLGSNSFATDGVAHVDSRVQDEAGGFPQVGFNAAHGSGRLASAKDGLNLQTSQAGSSLVSFAFGGGSSGGRHEASGQALSNTHTQAEGTEAISLQTTPLVTLSPNTPGNVVADAAGSSVSGLAGSQAFGSVLGLINGTPVIYGEDKVEVPTGTAQVNVTGSPVVG